MYTLLPKLKNLGGERGSLVDLDEFVAQVYSTPRPSPPITVPLTKQHDSFNVHGLWIHELIRGSDVLHRKSGSHLDFWVLVELTK